MSYFKIIGDESELKWFFEYGVPPLKKNEIYFVSMSLRKKKLDSEERKILTHNEMFNKLQIRKDDWEYFLSHIKRLEQRIDGYFPIESENFIHKAIVTYWNLSPINAYSAMKDQMAHLTEIMSELTDSALKSSAPALNNAYYKVRKSFDTTQSLFARNFGTKYWIDIDVDHNFTESEYDKVMQLLYNIVDSKNEPFFIPGDIMAVSTAGGIHFLLKRDKVKLNPTWICKEIERILPKAKEVVRNSNEMIPLVGTTQYENHIVRVLNKEDFNESHKIH